MLNFSSKYKYVSMSGYDKVASLTTMPKNLVLHMLFKITEQARVALP